MRDQKGTLRGCHSFLAGSEGRGQVPRGQLLRRLLDCSYSPVHLRCHIVLDDNIADLAQKLGQGGESGGGCGQVLHGPGPEQTV